MEGHSRGSGSSLEHEFLQVFQEDSYYFQPKTSIYYAPYGLFFHQNRKQNSVMLNSEEAKRDQMTGHYRKCNTPPYQLMGGPILHLFIPILISTNDPQGSYNRQVMFFDSIMVLPSRLLYLKLEGLALL